MFCVSRFLGSSAHKKLEVKQNPVSQDIAKAGKKATKPAREEEEGKSSLLCASCMLIWTICILSTWLLQFLC